MDLVFLASQLPEKGDARQGALGADAVAAMHTGSGVSINPKVWPCEDSVCVHRLGSTTLAAVADAHWGGSSSEAIVGGLAGAWVDTSGSPLDRLRTVLHELEGRFYEKRDVRDGSETTCLLVHLEDGMLSFANVGDSLLLAGPPPLLRLRNHPQGYFFGQFPLQKVQGAVELGQVRVQPGDVVLMATDGLEPEASGLSLLDVGKLLAGEASLEERVTALMARATDPDQGGGRDNLGVVALAVR